MAGVKVMVELVVLSETVPLVAPLTPVTVRGSPFGSVSLASKVEVEKVTGVFFVTAGPYR